jgi:hypothetical protein
MMTAPYDKKALRILFNTYWSPAGWRDKPTVSPEDFAYAKTKGLMFERCTRRHDEMVGAARALAEEIGQEAVANGFLASLTRRELSYRSALGSFAVSRWLPPHPYGTRRYPHNCSICGDYPEHIDEDMSVLNFERLKWGGVRHLFPYFAWFDLAEFRKLPTPSASTADRDVLKRVLDAAASQRRDARPSELEIAIAGLFPSNKPERRTALQILGYCGILQPVGHPSFFESYANMDNRAQPIEHKNDWNFPFVWWRGSDGVNARAVEFYFPSL